MPICHKHQTELGIGPCTTCQDETLSAIAKAGLTKLKEKQMHYRNGREAKNGDRIIQIDNGKVSAFGVLHGATAGNDYCNGSIAVIQQSACACMCDCLHIDDVNAMLAANGLDKRPSGK